MPKEQVFQIQENPKFKGYKGTFEGKNTTIDIQGTGSDDKIRDTFRGEEFSMSNKEYIDLKINALEQNMNQKIDAQGNLFVEKINHLETKLDSQTSLILSKFDALSSSIQLQNESIKKDIDNKFDSLTNIIGLQNDSLKKDIEIVTTKKISDLENSFKLQQKENKNFAWMIVGVAIAATSVIVSIVVPIIQHLLK